MRREIGLTTRCILVTLLLAIFVAQPSGVPAVELPERLGGREWWTLSTELSEPDGNFRSENLISNEMVLARLLPEVTARLTPNGVYLGVGPEQNFSYLAAIRPQMA